MLLTGRAFGVKNGTSAKLIDTGWFKYRVRIAEGPMEGRAGWVPNEFFVH